MTLPKTIILKNEEVDKVIDGITLDNLSDYLSDKYGFCHFSFNIEIKIKDIIWDRS